MTDDAPPALPYGRQSIDQDDIDAVVAVMGGDWLTQGPAIAEFESRLAAVTEAAHAVAFTSGTAALHAAAAAGGLGPGQVLATSPLTFSASAACARYVGAEPTLIDIDPTTLNIDVTAVPEGLDALVAVHYAGLPIDLTRLAHRPRVVIEDACHALGAHTPHGPVGNCAHSDMTCFSFHPVKPVTTGEGGAVTTNDPALADALRRFRNHGIVPRPDVDPWHYEVQTLGFNYRLTDIQAALGSSQLLKLPQLVARRNELADHYRVVLADLPLTLPSSAPEGSVHGYHLFAVQVPERRRVFEGLHEAGIRVQVHYVPIHHHPIYADIGMGAADLPNAEAAYTGLISLPMFPAMHDADVTRVAAALERLLT